MAGVPVINSTNTYPNLERWELIDENKEYVDVYNRYAHIAVDLYKTDKEIEEKFSLIAADMFRVNLSTNDLEILDIKYIFTSEDLNNFDTEEVDFEEVYNNYGYRIYRLNY